MTDYTRVKRRNRIIWVYEGFQRLGEVIEQYPKERIEIEYIIYHNKQEYIYALYFINKGKKLGAIYPHGKIQNNNLLS